MRRIQRNLHWLLALWSTVLASLEALLVNLRRLERAHQRVRRFLMARRSAEVIGLLAMLTVTSAARRRMMTKSEGSPDFVPPDLPPRSYAEADLRQAFPPAHTVPHVG